MKPNRTTTQQNFMIMDALEEYGVERLNDMTFYELATELTEKLEFSVTPSNVAGMARLGRIGGWVPANRNGGKGGRPGYAELKRQVDALEKRVEELEANKGRTLSPIRPESFGRPTG